MQLAAHPQTEAHCRHNMGLYASSVNLSAISGIVLLGGNAESYDMRNPAIKIKINEKGNYHICRLLRIEIDYDTEVVTLQVQLIFEFSDLIY